MRVGSLAEEDYVCTACHTVRQVQRPSGKLRKNGHRKHMMCPKCGVKVLFTKASKPRRIERWPLNAAHSAVEM